MELEHIVESQEIDTSEYIELGARHMRFREDTPFEVWAAAVTTLKSAEKSIQWWLGDALRFGERVYSEKYTQVLEETDYSYGTLRNASYVAGRIELSRRHDNLAFSHHQEVAALEPDEQDALLEQAAPEPGFKQPRLSTRQIREKAKELRTFPPEKAREHLQTSQEVADVETQPGRDDIVKIVRTAAIQFVVEFGNGDKHTVTRDVLLNAGYKKCSCCGYGVVAPNKT